MVPSDDKDMHMSQITNDDFHLYKFHDIMLEQNEKLSLPVFDIELPYKDIYHCKISSDHQSIKTENSKPGYGEHMVTAEV